MALGVGIRSAPLILSGLVCFSLPCRLRFLCITYLAVVVYFLHAVVFYFVLFTDQQATNENVSSPGLADEPFPTDDNILAPEETAQPKLEL